MPRDCHKRELFLSKLQKQILVMILQEKIKKEAEDYGIVGHAFIEGAKFALEKQWISVDDKMPYEYT